MIIFDCCDATITAEAAEGDDGTAGDGGTAVTPTSDTVTPASDSAPAPSVISPATPFAIALLLAVAGGITIEEYYRRRSEK